MLGIEHYPVVFQGIRTNVRHSLAKEVFGTDAQSEILPIQGNSHICNNLVVPNTLTIHFNGLMVGRDDGKGGLEQYHQIFKNFQITYSNSVIKYSFVKKNESKRRSNFELHN